MRSVLRVLLPLCMAAACGSTATTSTVDGGGAGTTDSGGAQDATRHRAGDARAGHTGDAIADGGLTCQPFQELCGTGPGMFCAAVQVDPDNCGGCGMQCTTGTYCSGGSCGAACTGLTSVLCSGTCVDTQSDNKNCGSCSHACPAGQVCSAGGCATTCAASYVFCGAGSNAYCAETRIDPDNCGACGKVCATGVACVNGHCSGDAGAPDAHHGDAAPIPDACVTTVEDCTNGVDDNCDGLVDCEDPQCSGAAAGFSCSVLPTEPGWTIVAYDATGRPACPDNFASPASDVVISASGASDTCNCNCTNTAPATCQGQWAWTTKGDTPACGTPPTSGINGVDNGACQNSSGTDNLNATFYFIGAANGVHTQAGSCSAASSVASAPPVQSVLGETCALPKAGTGCSLGAACAPNVPTGFQRCAVSTTATQCPNGLIQTTVATSISDTRMCGGCACGTVDLACNVTGMQFWEFQGCNGGVYDMNTSCQSVAGSSLGDEGGNSLSFKADLSTNGQQNACAVTSASQPSGSVTTKGSLLVCCEP